MFFLFYLQLQCVANYDFTGQDDEELNLKRGDIIHVTDKSDPNWWSGELKKQDGKIEKGVFPATYVSTYNG